MCCGANPRSPAGRMYSGTSSQSIPDCKTNKAAGGPVDVIVQPSTPCLNRSFPRRSTFTTPSDLAEYFRSSSMADMESGKCLPPRHYQIDKSLKNPILIGA